MSIESSKPVPAAPYDEAVPAALIVTVAAPEETLLAGKPLKVLLMLVA
jgi:hypothetical protein